jgi:hypothetical protein
MPFTRIKPENWPQDALAIPDGFGGMPPLEHDNRVVVGSEFFALSHRFDFPAGMAAHTTQRAILATPQDGDFWCDQIASLSWEELAGEDRDRQAFLASMLTIRDQRTGRSLIYNPTFNTFNNQGTLFPPDAVPINLFRKLPQSGTENSFDYSGDTPPPSGFRTSGMLIQPYCFTRQGGIEITLTSLFAAPAVTGFEISVAFLGWKEYANASQ